MPSVGTIVGRYHFSSAIMILWVDRYFFYDDNSTDRTLAILRAHDRVQVSRFKRSFPDSFVLSEQMFSNQCWKQSRDVTDWVNRNRC